MGVTCCDGSCVYVVIVSDLQVFCILAVFLHDGQLRQYIAGEKGGCSTRLTRKAAAWRKRHSCSPKSKVSEQNRTCALLMSRLASDASSPCGSRQLQWRRPRRPPPRPCPASSATGSPPPGRWNVLPPWLLPPRPPAPRSTPGSSGGGRMPAPPLTPGFSPPRRGRRLRRRLVGAPAADHPVLGQADPNLRLTGAAVHAGAAPAVRVGSGSPSSPVSLSSPPRCPPVCSACSRLARPSRSPGRRSEQSGVVPGRPAVLFPHYPIRRPRDRLARARLQIWEPWMTLSESLPREWRSTSVPNSHRFCRFDGTVDGSIADDFRHCDA